MPVLSSGFVDGSAGHTIITSTFAYLFSSTRGVKFIAPRFLTYDAVYRLDIQICLVLTLVVGRRGEWLRHLDHRQACVRPILPSISQFSADEQGWVVMWVILHPSPTFPAWADIFRDPMQWTLRRLPWHAPAWDAGAGGSAFVPGLARKHVTFWNEVSRNTHSVTSLYHPGVWNMEQAVS